MIRFFNFILVLGYACSGTWNIAEAKEMKVNSDTKTVSLGKDLRYLEDPQGNMSLEMFLSAENQKNLRNSESDTPSFGFTKSAYWFSVELTNQSDKVQELLLEFDYPHLDDLKVYWIDNNKLLREQQLGDHLLFDERPLKHPNFLVPFPMSANQKIKLVFRIKTSSSLKAGVVLHRAQIFWQNDAGKTIVQGLYFGIMIVMIIYNFFIYLSLRNKPYLYYVLYVAFYSVFQLCMGGLDYQYLWPTAPSVHSGALLFSFGGVLWSLSYFTRHFLQLSTVLPKLDIALKRVAIISAAMGITSIFVPYDFSVKILALLNLMVATLLIVIGTILVKRGNTEAQYFLLAFLGLSLGAVLLALRNFGILPSMFITDYAAQIGSTFEVILLSLALAHTIRVLKERAERYAEEVVKKEKARTLFFHNTSHELRTPLNGIIGFIDLVKQNAYGNIPVKAGSQLEKALYLAESLKLQINTILDLAKSKRGELDLKAQMISLDELKYEADNLAEGLKLKSKNIIYTSSLETEEKDFIGDHEKVMTIIRNLLGNAFKFHDPDRTNHVELKMINLNMQLKISVEDTGIGIPEESRQEIFEEFSQVQGNARRVYEGTGLGLSMARNLAILMNGEIECESKIKQGSIFTVTIPEQSNESIKMIKEEHNSEDEFKESFSKTNKEISEYTSTGLQTNSDENKSNLSRHQTNEIEIDTSTTNSWEVFIIDDTEMNCEVIADILKIDGYIVRYALSGSDGIAQMQIKRPDLLLLDMMMPEMSGEDVIKEMKNDPLLQEIPVILITARASEEDRLFGLNIGADDYLPKPIIVSELRLRVRNMIERHKLLKQVEGTTVQDKMFQLGELFGDLSHELKNILEGTISLKEIDKFDSTHSVSNLKIKPENIEVLSKAMICSSHNPDETERMQQLEKGPVDENKKTRRRIRRNLSRMEITIKDLKSIWQDVRSFDVNMLGYFDSQLRIFKQNFDLKTNMDRCQELTQSVLAYTREDHKNETANLKERMSIVRSMLLAKERNIGSKWEIQLGSDNAAIQPNTLTQVFLNLSMNALDALADLPLEERWIRTEATTQDEKIHIKWINGGVPIPKEISANLFKRGFTTKGDKGTGIGLYVSRRLISSAGGELIYDTESEYPCFILTIPAASKKIDNNQDDKVA